MPQVRTRRRTLSAAPKIARLDEHGPFRHGIIAAAAYFAQPYDLITNQFLDPNGNAHVPGRLGTFALDADASNGTRGAVRSLSSDEATNIPQTLTMAFWFEASVTPTASTFPNLCTYGTHPEALNPGGVNCILHSDLKIESHRGSGGASGGRFRKGATAVTLNMPVFVTCLVTGGTAGPVEIYLNGRDDDGGSIGGSGTNAAIGATAAALFGPCKRQTAPTLPAPTARIYNSTIWNRILDSAEIWELYDRGLLALYERPQSRRFFVPIALNTVTLSIGAAVQAQQSASGSVDAAIAQAMSATASADGAIALSQTVTAAIEAALLAQQTAKTSVEGAISQAMSALASADAAIALAQTAASSIDASITAPASVATISIEAAIQAATTASTALSAALAAVQSVATSVDAAVASTSTTSASINAALRSAITASASLDAKITSLNAPAGKRIHTGRVGLDRTTTRH